MKCWRKHSLTIVLFLLSLPPLGVAIMLKEGTWFDITVGLFHGFAAVALYNLLAGFFREVNKPEE